MEQQLTTEISIDTEYDITEIVTEDVPTSTERGTNKRLLEQYLIVLLVGFLILLNIHKAASQSKF